VFSLQSWKTGWLGTHKLELALGYRKISSSNHCWNTVKQHLVIWELYYNYHRFSLRLLHMLVGRAVLIASRLCRDLGSAPSPSPIYCS